MRDAAKNIGLGENLEIKLARLDKTDNKGTQCYLINTNLQVQLEMPSIRNDSDMLQGKEHVKISNNFINISFILIYKRAT